MLITEQECENILRNKDLNLLNQVLERVVQTAVMETLKGLPSLIQSLIAQLADVQKLSTDFYSKNPEFDKHKELVTRTIEKIESNNLTKSYEDILIEAEKEINNSIGLVKKGMIQNNQGLITLNEVNKLNDLLG